ncbi:MAG: BTAD domain-containing putative transcriptional regulator [Caldilineaceae bacterium]
MMPETTTLSKLSVRLFGAPQVTYEGETLNIPRNQVRALFYRLADEREWIARRHLCFLFWPDVADVSARQSLTLALSHLRRALPAGEMLVTDHVNARLADEAFSSDVIEFEALCEGEHRRIERLTEAVALYRGPFLDGVTLDNCPEFENWQLAERRRYERLFLDALSTLITDAVARGAYSEAINHAQHYLQVDPLEEEIHRCLIELYLATGDRSAAIQQYEQCVLLLEQELGVSPMPETFALYEASQHERPSNLPLPPTPLIGRKDEITQTAVLLRRDDVWLVTLNGAGGSGKTRLALEVAAKLLAHFRHGVYFVDLSPIRNPQLVLPTIARALGLPDVGVPPTKDKLHNFLSEKHLLLVLDNFEQVLAAAPYLTDLHAAASGVKILVTSRAALHLRGEREVPVPPLSLATVMNTSSPSDFLQSDAVRLFVERAQDVRPGFELNENNALTVARVCARVDGLPLAIELAAARCKLLTPQAILERLSAPLDLLSRGPRDLPDRQQTLRATITWSTDLLNTDERALFRRLGVLSGGFTVETAAAVCKAEDALDIDVIDGMAALLDHNLIRYATDTDDGEPRFTMLETIRSFAWDELEVRGELRGSSKS